MVYRISKKEIFLVWTNSANFGNQESMLLEAGLRIKEG
jgi:hypothetical protein